MNIAMPLVMAALALLVVGCQTTHTENAQQRAAPRSVAPFLMFQDGRAEEAIAWYVEVFRNASVVSIDRYGRNPVGAPEMSVQLAVFEIYGQRIMATESPIKHPFEFTPAVSLFVDLDSEREFDRVFAAMSDGGVVMMPPDNYGFSKKFAFLQDRFGVSWQFNLPAE